MDTTTLNPPAATALLTWDGLLLAHTRALAKAEKLRRAHNSAEVAKLAVKEPIIPPPDVLIARDHRPISFTINGKTHTAEAEDLLLSTAAEIKAEGGDQLLVSRRLAALATWVEAQSDARTASGLRELTLAEKAADQLWQDALTQRDEALHAVLRYPTSDPAKIAAKRALVEVDRRPDPSWCAVELDMIIEAMVTAGPPAPLGPAPDADKVAAWITARSAYEAVHAAYEATLDTIPHPECIGAPEELLTENLFYSKVGRWCNIDHFNADPLLSPDDRERLRPAVVAFLQLADTRKDSGPDEERDAREALSEAAYNALCDAERHLLYTPAPDADALLYKLRLIEREGEDDKFGFADIGRVAAKYASWPTHSPELVIYRDCLLMAGQDDPALHLETWSPAKWIEAYEAAGGLVTGRRDELIVALPALLNATAQSLLDELHAAPWKLRAIQIAGEERRGYGGDPYFDASGRYGLADRRGSRSGKTPPPPTIARAYRVTFVTKDGAPHPVIRYVDNSRALSVAA